jgi:hypothetical protein
VIEKPLIWLNTPDPGSISIWRLALVLATAIFPFATPSTKADLDNFTFLAI